MAVIATLNNNVSTTDGTSFNTGANTPTVGDLLLLMFGVSGQTTAVPAVTKNSVVVPGFDFVASARFGSGANTLYFYVGAGLEVPVARTITVTFGGTFTGNSWNLMRVSGMKRTGLGAIRQIAIQNNVASATPAPVFPAACLTGNPVIGIIGNETNPATMTPPTGFTEIADQGYATPTTGYEGVLRNSGFTGSTLTWGSVSASAFGALAVELDTRDWTANDYPPVIAGMGATR